MRNYVSPAGLEPIAFWTTSLTVSAAVSIKSTLLTATVLDISVEDQDVRLRHDGTDPTDTTGVLLGDSSGQPYRFEGYNGTSNFKAIATTGTAKISVMGWRPMGG